MASRSAEDHSGTAISCPNGVRTLDRSNSTLVANTTARLAITPTTAAVMAESAPESRTLPRSRSTDGAPRKIQRKLGTNVAHAATSAPPMPATSGGSDPGSRNAPTNATNTTTRMSGPGVVSARLSPTAISDEVSHPNRTTAAWLTYARTAYAPPNVTSDATVKKTASCASTVPPPAASATAPSGSSQTD